MLRASVQALLERHPNLRAGFRSLKQGKVVQVIATRVDVPWREVDLGGLEGAAREAAVAGLLEEDRVARFEVGRPPLLRCLLLRLAPDRFRFVLTNHHILLDGWSLPLLIRELFALYEHGGDDAGLARVRPYRDYLAWLAGQDRAAMVEEWRRALAGLSEPTLVAPGRTDRTVTRPEHLLTGLSEEDTTALTGVARAHGLTLNSLVQGVWGVLLARLTGRDDVVFGVTVSGRPPQITGIENMIGLFINTVPVRVRLDPEVSLPVVCARVQQQQARLMDSHYVGLAEIQRAAGLGELFDTLFVFENYPLDGDGVLPRAGGVEVTGARSWDATHYPLSLAVIPGRALRFRLDYRADVFDADAAAVIAERLVRLLRAVAADPDRPTGRLDILGGGERRELAERFNDTACVLPAAGLPELLAEQAERTADAVAVVSDGVSLTYRELHRRVNRLAHRLIGMGAGPEGVVALVLPRSVDLVVAVLAVLKTGAAYLPVDADYPAQRVEFMLDDARPVLAVTTCATRGMAGPVPQLVLDSPDTTALLAAMPEHEPADTDRTGPLSPAHPAYVIYTSGSTGRPKGVVMTHEALLNLLTFHRVESADVPSTTTAQFTSISFDVATQEILSALCFGKTLAVPGDEVRKDPSELLDWLERHRVNEFFAPTLVLEALCAVAEEEQRDLPELRYLAQGGEALTLSKHIRDFCARGVGRQLHNHYGPSETHESTAYTLPANTLNWPETAPIGRPISNTRVYVLNDVLQPSPYGETGELYIAGTCLARGYLHRPGLTAERFLADPFASPGARMYRTGDLVRWNADGALEFIARADSQIKIRGFRVEPGEVEAVLGSHPEVTRVAVVAGDDAVQGKRLVAYVVRPGATHTPSALRSYLRTRLPAYMVPAFIVDVDALPLMPNGKLDRRALPAPDETYTVSGRRPMNPQEEIVCELFAEVLGLAAVDPDDSFFDLGGHSLSATRLTNRIRSVLGLELPVRAVFEAPSVAALAKLLRDAGRARPSLEPEPRPDLLPLSFAQRRLWILDQMEGPSPTYNIPLALRLTGSLSHEALQTALWDVVGKHEILRTIYSADEGVPCQVVLDSPQVRPPLDKIKVVEAELSDTLTAASRQPFDLAVDCPWRASLFELDEKQHVLLLVVHHIAADGWSLAPLYRDLAAAYAARVAGEVPTWASLTAQYADYTIWQRQLLGSVDDPGSLLSQQLVYWRERLDGLPDELDLAADYARPPVASHIGDTSHFVIPDDLHSMLVAMGRDNQATLFMVLQAALATLLTRLGAGDDIVIGSPIAGRTDENLHDLVGFFVNTLVLRTDLNGNPSFQEVLKRVRGNVLGAYMNQDLPFEHLVEDLNPTRSLSRNPLFQVMLTVHNLDDLDLRMPGLSIAAEHVPSGISRTDLGFNFVERRSQGGEPDGMDAVIEYNTDLWSKQSIEDLGLRYLQVLRQAVMDPAQPAHQIQILSADERRELVESWTAVGIGEQESALPELFRTQVAQTPDTIAVQQGDETLTYQELDVRASHIARLLVVRGVRQEDVVAVALPRSIDLIASALAVMKVGATYLPLDIGYPAERVGLILKEAQPALLLTDSTAAAPYLPSAFPTVMLDDAEIVTALTEGAMSGAPPAMDFGHVSALTAACAVFTSGSTGTPKGVVLSHANVVNMATAHIEQLGLKVGSRVLQTLSVAFDVAIADILMTLLSGATLVLADADTTMMGDELAHVLRRTATTHATLPPAVLATVSDRDLPTLTCVVTGGEACTPDTVARWSHAVDMVNVYGATEVADCATMNHRHPGDRDPRAVGVVVDKARVYVLDQNLDPVPTAVVGEAYIAGPGVARGYLMRPGATAERFVPDIFGPPGTRMYRTGDRVRWRRDGNLEFLGRTDNQVKLRGFRIELGEIDAILAEHPAVSEARAMVREDRPGDRRLVAYVAPAPDADATTAPTMLREYAIQQLPAHMVPAVVVVLDTLPLGPTGKVDYRALPAPHYESSSSDRPPNGPQEEMLCDLFAEVLGVATVGVDDSFFELGGHSILAVQLINRIRDSLGAKIAIRDLFEAPTVFGLAGRLASDSNASAFEVLLPMRTTGQHAPLFCVHPAGGISWCYSGLINALGADYPIYGLQARGLAEPEELPSSIEEMATEYAKHVRTVQPSGPYRLLGWSFGGIVAQAIAVQLQRDGCEVEVLAILDAYPTAGSAAEAMLDGESAFAALFGAAEGVNESLDGKPLMELMRREGAALGNLEDRHLAGIRDIFINNVQLARSHAPDVFDGDILFFSATHGRTSDLPTSTAWRPYINGEIEDYAIPCQHSEMTQPGPLREIGPILCAKLQKVTPV
ncbi:non-ribosomal peptide synthetase [Streptomyces prasinus]|uniref:Non-ribosomal peptide synthetase n=1 Tax=Streptomyces prasinus TaxID=67345 RepID=A0ABX6AQJ7_9ACTN|nr:non-ribosomal peptide synthetase [Streptomyces prasinus]